MNSLRAQRVAQKPKKKLCTNAALQSSSFYRSGEHIVEIFPSHRSGRVFKNFKCEIFPCSDFKIKEHMKKNWVVHVPHVDRKKTL